MRKLALVSAAFSVAVFLSNYIFPVEWLLYLTAGSFLAGLLTLPLRKRGIFRRLCGAALAAALGFLVFWVNYQMTTVPAQELDGTRVHMEARILTTPEQTRSGSRATVRVSIDGIPHLKAVYYDYSGALLQAKPGDMLSAEVGLRNAGELYGESYDTYKAKGISLICSGKGTPEITPGPAFWLPGVPQWIARDIRERLEAVFPAEHHAFLRALMLGDKSELYEDNALYVAMTRAGFMHVVAVSGMHITFLIGAIQFLFGKRPKDALFCILLVWVFVLVTGSSHSAVRAAFMQTVLLLAPVLKREEDPPTSLSFALAVILLVNPYACAGISLQLSFAAIAGLYFVSGRLSDGLFDREKDPSRLTRLLRYPAGVLASSIGVLVFTIPLTVLHFGYVAVLSFFTNLLGLWAVGLCFCGAYAACLLDFFLPALGSLAGWFVSLVVRYLTALVKGVSAVPFAVVYVNNAAAVFWVAAVYGLFLLFAVLRLRPWLRLLCPLGLSAAALALLIVCVSHTNSTGAAQFAVLDVGQGLCTTAIYGDTTVVVDCGNTYNRKNAGDLAAAYLLSRERHSVNLLVLTHLDSDHVNGVPRLLQYLDVHEILLPVAEDEADRENEALIREAAALTGTQIIPLIPENGLTRAELVTEYAFPSGLTVTLYPVAGENHSNEDSTFIVLSAGEYAMMITGDADAGRESDFARLHGQTLADIDVLVVGHHGSRYSSGEEFLSLFGGKTAVISVGYNPYGHPTDEALDRLYAAGFSVFRTDEDGDVILQEGKEWPKSRSKN